MPQIATVVAALWDLRAQCEQQMRAITDAQRLFDRYRDQPDTQLELKAGLHADVQMVRAANTAIESALSDCERMINALPVAKKRATTT